MSAPKPDKRRFISLESDTSKIKTLIGRDDDDNFPLLFSRKSDGYLRAYSAAHVVAPTNLNVMIIGESGVGKEPLAHETELCRLRSRIRGVLSHWNRIRYHQL